MSPQKTGGAFVTDNNSKMQKSGSPVRCVICEVMRQTKRDPIADQLAYQNWLRGRKMTKKVRGELWKISLVHTENEMKRINTIFKSMK